MRFSGPSRCVLVSNSQSMQRIPLTSEIIKILYVFFKSPADPTTNGNSGEQRQTPRHADRSVALTKSTFQQRHERNGDEGRCRRASKELGDQKGVEEEMSLPDAAAALRRSRACSTPTSPQSLLAHSVSLSVCFFSLHHTQCVGVCSRITS